MNLDWSFGRINLGGLLTFDNGITTAVFELCGK